MTRERITLADAVLEVARAELQARVTEATGKNDGVPSIRYMGGRCEPWCGWFVAWCFRQCGAPLPDDRGHPDGSASPLAGVAHLQRVLVARGWAVTRPMRGDIVTFKRRDGSDAGPGMHVGIVDRVSPAGSSISTIEGNRGDAVGAGWYRMPRDTDRLVSAHLRVPTPPGWTYVPRPLMPPS